MEEQTNEALWYVVHTYSGYENKVKANICLLYTSPSPRDCS